MKKILTIVLSFVLLVTPVFASMPDGSNRTDLPNYGVNKKEARIDTTNMDKILRVPYVDSTKKIYDYGELLNAEEKNELLNLIGSFVEHTKMEVVILTIDLPYIYDIENENYAVDFYDYNDFGLNFEHYSGVLIYRNKNEKPYYGIYTFGDAQLYFDDSRLNNISDGVYSYYQNNEYLNGFKYIINRLTNYYDDGKALPNYYLDDMGYIHKKYTVPYGLALGGGAVVSIITLIVLVKKNKMIKKATEANDYLVKDSVKYNTRSDILTGSITTHYTIQHDSGGGGGGHSSRGGSSGMGHGGVGRHG